MRRLREKIEKEGKIGKKTPPRFSLGGNVLRLLVFYGSVPPGSCVPPSV